MPYSMREDEDPSSRSDQPAGTSPTGNPRSAAVPTSVVATLVLVAIVAALCFLLGRMRTLSGIVLGAVVGYLLGLRAGEQGAPQPRVLQPLSDRVKQIAQDPDRKIEAIRIYREETGADLREGRDAVEEYINTL